MFSSINFFSESEDEDEEFEYKKDGYLRKLLFENKLFKIYQISTREFVNNIKMWSCQRELNTLHVKNLEQSILDRGYLLGTFKVIRDKNCDLRLIDGQHRVTALQNLMDKNSKFDCDSIVELYEVDSFENEESIKLFFDANNTLNINGKDTTSSNLQRVLQHFVNEYPGIIIDVKEGKRCNRPRINKRIFVTKLKQLVLDYDQETIIKTISEYNKKMGRFSNEVLRLKCGSYSTKMYDIAKENGCFLGLIPDFGWIEELEFL
jgi:hypothetical protein